uniref:Uncharacterized protein n=1 Tax=viral metagenome TaxID=1070528 RepID=A0A6C0C189_9ZZZZ
MRASTSQNYTRVTRESIGSLPSLLRIHHRTQTVLLHSEMLGESEVLRKMSDAEGDIRSDDPNIFSACLQVSCIPNSPAELQKWIAAHDFLCSFPCPEMLFAAVSKAFRYMLHDTRSLLECARHVYPAYRPLHERICERTCIVKGFTEDVLDPIPTSLPKPSSPPPAGDTDAAPGIYEAPLALSPNGLWLSRRSGQNCSQLIDACEKTSDFIAAASLAQSVPSLLWAKSRELVRGVLLGLGDQLGSAPGVIMNAQRLLGMLTVEEFRWLARRSLVVMGAAEDSPTPFFLDGEYVHQVQALYKDCTLDLNSLCHLLEASRDDFDLRTGLYLLPGCYGREEVPKVHLEPKELRKTFKQKVPWLESLWAQLQNAHFKCYVTGSMLTAVLQPHQSGSTVLPGDIDLFVEDKSNLEECFLILRKSVACKSPSTTLSFENISANKLRVQLQCNEATTYIDLYAHPLLRISRYHMSLVRVAFDGDTLYFSPTAASAVATGLSADFSIKWKEERTKGIIWRKWASGASLIVNQTELNVFLKYALKCIECPKSVGIRLRKAVRASSLSSNGRVLKLSRRFYLTTNAYATERLRWRA